MTKTVKEMIDEINKMQQENLVNNLDIVFLQILKVHEKEIVEKDELIKSLAYDCSEYLKIIKRNADERQTQLKKSDVEVKIWCSHCEYWVTDDIQDCYCQCTCKETEDYSCIYEEDINAENDCPRNKEWIWEYKISSDQYESLED